MTPSRTKQHKIFPLLRPVFASLIIMTVVLGVFYPLILTGTGSLLFPSKHLGSPIKSDNKGLTGSTLIAQPFTLKNTQPNPGYFQPRPSSTAFSTKVTAFSNLGPNSRKLAELLRQRVNSYRTFNHLPATTAVPSDAIMSSASGVDPDISPRNAALQAKRVAEFRHLPLRTVLHAISQHTTERWLGIFGEPRVNVVTLNLQLEKE